jgi:hypothetical protein
MPAVGFPRRPLQREDCPPKGRSSRPRGRVADRLAYHQSHQSHHGGAHLRATRRHEPAAAHRLGVRFLRDRGSRGADPPNLPRTPLRRLPARRRRVRDPVSSPGLSSVRHCTMRLTEQQRCIVAEAAAETFGPTAQVLLFGSRLDDERRGGDIDLLVQCPAPVDNAGLVAARMAAKIQLRLCEHKGDVLYWWPGMHQSAAHRAAIAQGKRL